MKYFVTTSSCRQNNETPCNVKELEHCLKTIPKNGISEIAFYQIIVLSFVCVAEIQWLERHFGMDYMQDIKGQSPEN